MGKERMRRKTEEQNEGAALAASSRFFQNRGCKYFPCHDMEPERFNCLFCYCPLYHCICPGEADYISLGDKEIKDCSRCDFPHRPENYDAVVEQLIAMLYAGN